MYRDYQQTDDSRLEMMSEIRPAAGLRGVLGRIWKVQCTLENTLSENK